MSDLDRLIAAFRAGDCPGEVLADFLEDPPPGSGVKPDAKKAEAVRAACAEKDETLRRIRVLWIVDPRSNPREFRRPSADVGVIFPAIYRVVSERPDRHRVLTPLPIPDLGGWRYVGAMGPVSGRPLRFICERCDASPLATATGAPAQRPRLTTVTLESFVLSLSGAEYEPWVTWYLRYWVGQCQACRRVHWALPNPPAWQEAINELIWFRETLDIPPLDPRFLISGF